MLEEEYRFVERLVARSGPTPEDYTAVNNWFQRVNESAASEEFTKADVLHLSDAFGDAMPPGTLLGLGYIIDRTATRGQF